MNEILHVASQHSHIETSSYDGTDRVARLFYCVTC